MEVNILDKEKITNSISEVKILVDELVGNGTLDGEQAKQILYDFTIRCIRAEFFAPVTED